MLQKRTPSDRRVDRLNSTYMAMSRGVVTTLRKDGLIVVQPARRTVPFPFKFLLIMFTTLFLFKGFLLAWLGPDTYDNRIADLAAGTFAEQAGAWVMQIEPASQFLPTRSNHTCPDLF